MVFAHLHVASGSSARYGPSHPEHLVRQAAERGMGSQALTDRDNVTGMVRFARACAAHGVRPVFGVDLASRPLTWPTPPTPPLPRQAGSVPRCAAAPMSSSRRCASPCSPRTGPDGDACAVWCRLRTRRPTAELRSPPGQRCASTPVRG
jgi:hypothetical protein